MKLIIIDTSQISLITILPALKALTNCSIEVWTNRPDEYAGLNWALAPVPAAAWLPWSAGVFNKAKEAGAGNVLLIGEQDKLKITAAASKAGLKVFWLELAENSYVDPVKLLAHLGSARALCLSSGVADDRQTKGWPADNLVEVPPLLESLPSKNISTNGDYPWIVDKTAIKRLFTLGTRVDLHEPQLVEKLFSVLTSCREIGLALQLVVIGEGEEKHKLEWLAEKMDLGKSVCFVGERRAIERWLPNFDLFLVASTAPSSADLMIVLAALAAGVPVLSPTAMALNDLVVDGKTGIKIDLDDTNATAAIIKYWHDNVDKRKLLARNGQKLIEEQYLLASGLAKWRALFK